MAVKLAGAVCTNPHCRTIYESVIDDRTTVLKCPVCGQYNTIKRIEPVANGRCRCERPLDDHKWQGDYAVCAK